MSSSTLDLIATKVLTMKDEARLCEVKDNLNKLSTKDPGSHEPSTRDNLYRWTKDEARLCEFNLKLSFLPPRVKLKQSCSNKVTQTSFILNEGYVKDIFQNKFKTRMLNYGDISHWLHNYSLTILNWN
jgi:hypothetical protein